MPESFQPNCSLENLKRRSQLQQFLRQWFEQQQYWEVETPLLSQETVVDAYIDPFVVVDQNQTRFLQTSPEFAMKRLLASGADRIFQLCKAFRKEEVGPWHNSEFTLLEWYACQSTAQDQIDFTGKLVVAVDQFLAQQQSRPPRLEQTSIAQVTYDQAFQNALQVSALEATDQQLIESAKTRSQPVPEILIAGGRDAILNFLLAEYVEPWLKTFPAVFLTHYPASQAALARVSEEDPRTAERFELYLEGLEIANGYFELLDASVLQERNHQQNAQRVSEGFPALPEQSRLLEAMQHGLPECSGVAVGFDRLMAWGIGAKSLEEVMPFRWSIA